VNAGVVIGLLVLAIPLVLIGLHVRRASAGRPASPAKGDSFVTLKGNGAFEIEAVGESHYQAQLTYFVHPQTGYVEIEREAILRCENDNPHDDQAVQVRMDHYTVGYLSRADARKYRAILERMGFPEVDGKCLAKICGGGRSRPNYGVWIDI
jgi:hypothetical protein